MSCVNCLQPIRSSQLVIQCNGCKNNLHFNCLGIPEDAIFAIKRIKSPNVKFSCTKCSSYETRLDELKSMILDMETKFSNRLTLLENFVEKLDTNKIKQEILSECMEQIFKTFNKQTEIKAGNCVKEENISQNNRSIVASTTTKSTTRQKQEKCGLTYNVTYPLHATTEGTIIIYFSPKDQIISEEMKLLDEKFHFLQDFLNSKKRIGDIIIFNKDPHYLLCGCIIKKLKNDKFDLNTLQKCVQKIHQANKIYRFHKIAFQSLKDEVPDLNKKISNIIRNSIRDVELYVCRPEELQSRLNSNHCFNDERSSNYEYELYELENHDSMGFSRVKENSSSHLLRKSLAYLVTEDMKVDGEFQQNNNFNNFLGQLLNQNQKEGNCAVVKYESSDYIYCAILRQFKSTRLDHRTVFSSLQQIKEHAVRNSVKKIVFPKINFACETFGKKQFKWMLEFLFMNTDIEIILTPPEKMQTSDPENLKLSHVASGFLQQTKKKSIIIYFCNANGHETEEMKTLSKSFNFLESYRRSDKVIGDIIPYLEYVDRILFGCVVLKEDRIDFVALQKCITKINEANKIKKFRYIYLQAVKDSNNSTNFKIFNILMNNLENVDIKICWPGDLLQQMPLNAIIC